jgi:hypothetical protein
MMVALYERRPNTPHKDEKIRVGRLTISRITQLLQKVQDLFLLVERENAYLA